MEHAKTQFRLQRALHTGGETRVDLKLGVRCPRVPVDYLVGVPRLPGRPRELKPECGGHQDIQAVLRHDVVCAPRDRRHLHESDHDRFLRGSTGPRRRLWEYLPFDPGRRATNPVKVWRWCVIIFA